MFNLCFGQGVKDGDKPIQDPQLLWREDFAGDGSLSGLDEASWSCHIGNGSEYGIPGWGNSELQQYTAKNLRVTSDGLLLTASQRGGKYYSAKVCTKGKRDFCPIGISSGIRVEARLKLPEGGQGIWPAFWMLPSEGPDCTSGEGLYGHWPMSGEIDIMEAVNDMKVTSAAIHFGGPGSRRRQVSASLPEGHSLDRGYHVYRLDWRPHSMTFYVDKRPILKTVCSCTRGSKNGWHTANGAGSRKCSSCSPFDRPFHIIFNLAVGGSWPGNPNCFTQFPQTMTVQSLQVFAI